MNRYLRLFKSFATDVVKLIVKNSKGLSYIMMFAAGTAACMQNSPIPVVSLLTGAFACDILYCESTKNDNQDIERFLRFVGGRRLTKKHHDGSVYVDPPSDLPKAILILNELEDIAERRKEKGQ